MEGKSPLSEDVKKQFTSNRSYDDHKEVEPPNFVTKTLPRPFVELSGVFSHSFSSESRTKAFLRGVATKQ
ncbi:unnamed protein product [Ceratitis capitata]|uniref:(Mediterranean fruit fly) hypothetical protein n=1 Tax=Ceratitis capitata TaxID=7213 RepID=A0A811V9Z4_CERCA|nr:unnamed protein product [Ceratitis capitata]